MPQPQKEVLITSGSWQGALACVQSLGHRGHEVYVLARDETTPLVHSKYCRTFYRTPDEAEEGAYLDFLLQILQQHQFDVLIPISDAVVHLVSANRADICKKVNICLPSEEAIAIAGDKKKTYHWAQQHAIPIPETYCPQERSEIHGILQKIGFPCIVKYAHGAASEAVFTVGDASEVEPHFQSADPNQWPVLQQYHPNKFYGMTGVCKDGEILGHLMFRVDYQFTKKGTPAYAYTCVDQKLFDPVQKIIRTLNWTGAIDLDLIADESGQLLLLEVNPRFSGTLNFATKLGIDLPEMYVQLALGLSVPPMPQPFSNEHRFCSFFPTAILHAYKNRGWVGVVQQLLKIKDKTNLYLNDLPLTHWQVKNTWWDIQHHRSMLTK